MTFAVTNIGRQEDDGIIVPDAACHSCGRLLPRGSVVVYVPLELEYPGIGGGASYYCEECNDDLRKAR